MGRAPCCEKVGLKRGRWTVEEDEILMKYIENNGEGSWRSLPKNAGLLRCGKSCRLRWLNYLKTDLKRGNISPEEDTLIIKLHNTLGNRWSIIAGHLPGRTDNEIKNYWNSHLSRRIDSFRRPNNGHETLPPILMNLSKINGGYKIKRHGRISRATMKKNNHHSNVVKKSNSYVSMPTSQEETTTTLVASISLKQNDEIIQTMSMVSPYLERGSVVLCSSSEEREGPTPTSVNNNQERERERLGPNQGLETEKLTMCSNDTMDSWLMGFDEERECVGFDSNPKTTSEEERGEMSITNATTIRDDLSQISDWHSNSDSNAVTLCFEDQRWVDWDWVDRVEGHKLWADCEQMLSW